MDFTDNKFTQFFYDIKNFILFKRMYKKESSLANSPMTTMNIKSNWFGNILYVQVNCTDTDLMNADYDRERMILTKIKPIVSYLGKDLGWSEYLVPQISNFVDEDGEPSLSYGVLFIFTGYSMTLTKLLFSTVFTVAAITTGVWALCHYLL